MVQAGQPEADWPAKTELNETRDNSPKMLGRDGSPDLCP